jgi:hypothetical protein
MTSPAASRTSTVRLVAGVAILLAAAVATWTGFSGLFAALDAHGYGSPEVRRALIWMGVAGGAIGAGVSLLVWELSIRLAQRTERTDARSRQSPRG